MSQLLPAGFPVTSIEKAWVEARLRWLADSFGMDRLLETEVILPTPEYFPDTYSGSREDAHRLLDRLCELMGLNPETIELRIVDDEEIPDAAGDYVKEEVTFIRIAQSQLHDPERLVATLCHELSHELLLGGGLVTAETPDHEQVTDLLSVYLGLGIFAANGTIRESSQQYGTANVWSYSQQGYLTSRELGYAFAVFAFVRQEDNPEWAKHLRLDAQVAVREGLKYLQKTGDSIFHPDTCYNPLPNSDEQLIQQLRTGSPSAQIDALRRVVELERSSTQLVEAMAECLYSKDPHVPGLAAKCLGRLGEAATPTIPQLIKALEHKSVGTRTGAVEALGHLQVEPKEVMSQFITLLGEENRTLIHTTVWALREVGGVEAATALPALMKQLHAALVDCDYPLMDEMTETLKAITSNPEEQLEASFAHDPELLHLALQSLAGETPDDPEAWEEDWDEES